MLLRSGSEKGAKAKGDWDSSALPSSVSTPLPKFLQAFTEASRNRRLRMYVSNRDTDKSENISSRLKDTLGVCKKPPEKSHFAILRVHRYLFGLDFSTSATLNT
jgi:hypothetical protein